MSPQEAEYLLASLRADLAPRRVAVLGEGAIALGGSLSERFPRSDIIVVVANVADKKVASERLRAGNVRVELSMGLGFLGGSLVEIVVVRSSGYEGRQRFIAQLEDSQAHLADGGIIYLVTHVKRGAKGQSEALEALVGDVKIEHRGAGGARILSAVRRSHAPSGVLPDAKAPGSRTLKETIYGKPFVFKTAPTVFSKDRLDPGTRFLLETLPPDVHGSILDLGCGYGPIGIALARCFPETRVTLVDYELKAVELARDNVSLNGVESNATVTLSDGLEALRGVKFDLVLTHFPLHIPKSELVRILSEACDSLTAGGRLCGVALRAYDVRPAMVEVFGHVETIAETGPPSCDYEYHILRAFKR
ncbi:MAG: class I SAM-dependent methyltransferase [bacterium]